MDLKDRFLSRKFFLTCSIVALAGFNLEGGDLAGVLIACVSAYSLGNVGEYWFARKDQK